MLLQRILLGAIFYGVIFSSHLYAKISLETEKELTNIAMNSIKTVAGTLQNTLETKIKDTGFASAAQFCSLNIKSLAQELSQQLPQGVTIRRITDRPRNPKNEATPKELSVLNELRSKINAGEHRTIIIKEKAQNHYQVYKPILVKGKCLNCHGIKPVINQEAYKVIAKHYPNDMAIDYSPGDFRGAFLVDIKR